MISPLLALEKSKHAARALALRGSCCVRVNRQCRVLASEIRPATAAIKGDLDATGGTCYSVAIGWVASRDVFAPIVVRCRIAADWLRISRLVTPRCSNQPQITCGRCRHCCISSNGPRTVPLGLQRRWMSRMLRDSGLFRGLCVPVVVVSGNDRDVTGAEGEANLLFIRSHRIIKWTEI